MVADHHQTRPGSHVHGCVVAHFGHVGGEFAHVAAHVSQHRKHSVVAAVVAIHRQLLALAGAPDAEREVIVAAEAVHKAGGRAGFRGYRSHRVLEIRWRIPLALAASWRPRGGSGRRRCVRLGGGGGGLGGGS
eukprot:ctg_1231.g300